MQCGPICHEAGIPLAATRELHVHETPFEPQTQETDGTGMQELYNEIAHDQGRNQQVADLVLSELALGTWAVAPVSSAAFSTRPSIPSGSFMRDSTSQRVSTALLGDEGIGKML